MDPAHRCRGRAGEIPGHGRGGNQGLEDHRRFGRQAPDQTAAEPHSGKGNCRRAGLEGRGRGKNGFRQTPGGRRCHSRRHHGRRQDNGQGKKVTARSRCYGQPQKRIESLSQRITAVLVEEPPAHCRGHAALADQGCGLRRRGHGRQLRCESARKGRCRSIVPTGKNGKNCRCTKCPQQTRAGRRSHPIKVALHNTAYPRQSHDRYGAKHPQPARVGRGSGPISASRRVRDAKRDIPVPLSAYARATTYRRRVGCARIRPAPAPGPATPAPLRPIDAAFHYTEHPRQGHDHPGTGWDLESPRQSCAGRKSYPIDAASHYTEHRIGSRSDRQIRPGSCEESEYLSLPRRAVCKDPRV